MIALCKALLDIPSPTFKEQEIQRFIRQFIRQQLPQLHIQEHKDNILASSPEKSHLPHVALVGHVDVVPPYFPPYMQAGKLYGAGASDMLGGVAAFLFFLQEHIAQLLERYNITLILYVREEGTKLEENGLYDLIQFNPQQLKKIDVAIVGEPTDNTIQLGCVGSIHAQITIKGQACHSARPWQGDNALYKALPVIQALSQVEPVAHEKFGVTFFDVCQITESASEIGRTSIPGYWQANVNYRFAPVYTVDQACAALHSILHEAGLTPDQYHIVDCVGAGQVIENDLFRHLLGVVGKPVKAKQAWTDVAQLTDLGISAFNYGPGRADQAHQATEYIVVNDLQAYYRSLLELFEIEKS